MHICGFFILFFCLKNDKLTQAELNTSLIWVDDNYISLIISTAIPLFDSIRSSLHHEKEIFLFCLFVSVPIFYFSDWITKCFLKWKLVKIVSWSCPRKMVSGSVLKQLCWKEFWSGLRRGEMVLYGLVLSLFVYLLTLS